MLIKDCDEKRPHLPHSFSYPNKASTYLVSEKRTPWLIVKNQFYEKRDERVLLKKRRCT
jgi:hypothetical protein